MSVEEKIKLRKEFDFIYGQEYAEDELFNWVVEKLDAMKEKHQATVENLTNEYIERRNELETK